MCCFVLVMFYWHEVYCGNITECPVQSQLLIMLFALQVWHDSKSGITIYS
jgi:hypothetical protein